MISTKSFLLDVPSWCVCIFLLLNSCASWKADRMSLSTNKRLSQEIAEKKIADQSKYGNGTIFFVDPLFKERSAIFNMGEFLEGSKLFPDLLYPSGKHGLFPLAIPDSLSKRVRYITSKTDVENGPETVFFFSPLLPTKRQGVFAMQIYMFDTMHEEGLPIEGLRTATRNYDLYQVKKGHTQYLETLSAPEDFFSLPLLHLDRH